MFGEPVVNYSCAFFTAREAAGAAGTRRFLRPLLFEGKDRAKLGCNRAAGTWTYVTTI